MANIYLEGIKEAFKNNIDLDGSTIKACLVESTCTFTETHATLSAVLAVGSGELDAAGGYARQTLSTKAVTIASGKVKFTSDDVVFSSVDSADTAIAMVIFYDPGTGDGNCIPLVYADFPDEVFTSGNLKTLTVACPANGWFYMSNA